MPKLPVHHSYSIGQDDEGFYINHYTFSEWENFARRETLYSEIPTEDEAYELANMLEKYVQYNTTVTTKDV